MKLLRPISQLSLLSKMILLICSLMIIITISLGIYSNTMYANTIKEQIGIRALHLAETVANIPEIKEAFQQKEPSSIIQPIVEDIRETTDSEFIVVGNREGVRYSHPLEERIGMPMVGDDNERALLLGKSYVSESVGSLGPSIRGKAPIFANNGEIIGVVSVGILVDDIEMTVGNYVQDIWAIVFICTLVGIVGAIIISLHIKKSILGLEPVEIGLLFQEREAMLQSIHEALIAVDKQGNVTMYNHAAEKVIGNKEKKLTGKHVKELLPYTKLTDVLITGKSQFNQEFWIKDERFIVNCVPLYNENKLIGAVSTFRNITEIEKLAEELSKVKQYSEALRVQTHEFSNKLNTISGLLQLEKVSDAINFINKESKKQQEWIHFLINSISDSYISALLLGKLNRAHELGIVVTIEPESKITASISEKQREALVTILGNLLENAYDAVLEQKEQREISIFFTDEGSEFIFEIEDSGKGITSENAAKIFSKGFTTKGGKHRGIGLSLVQKLIADLNGELLIDNSGLGGACFIVSIPKQREN